MAVISVKNLLEAGVHFGHRVSRWNPKMAPYIFGKRNLIHIINLRETVKGLIRAYHFLYKITGQGKEVIFVGTKRQAKTVVKKLAQQCEMHYVSERWLGGSLTNFETIRLRLARLEELEKMEEDGTMESMSKKYASALRREKKKITRNLEGIKNMDKLPGALVIVDPKKEHIALKEAAKLGIPTICLIDTDSNPSLVDIAIPGNDDAMRSIEVICTKLMEAVAKGHAEWEEQRKLEKKAQEAAGESTETSHKRRGEDKNARGRRGRTGRGRDNRGGGGRRRDRKRPETREAEGVKNSPKTSLGNDTSNKMPREKTSEEKVKTENVAVETVTPVSEKVETVEAKKAEEKK